MILAPLTNRPDVVMARVGRSQQPRNFLGGILQVGVQGDDDVACDRLKGGHDGGVLAKLRRNTMTRVCCGRCWYWARSSATERSLLPSSTNTHSQVQAS